MAALRALRAQRDRQLSAISRLSVASTAQPRTATRDRYGLAAQQTRRAGRDMSDRRAGSASILPANDRRRFHVDAFTVSYFVGRFEARYHGRTGLM
jgi:hypothetical protein